MKTIYPGGAFEELLYDAKGNLARVTDPNTLISRYGYASLDRLCLLTAPDLAASTITHNSADGESGFRSRIIPRTKPRPP
ncbi:MAG: RHS repeat protein [Deltaproteobacteria bacterium]|nr:RHS repeat protein [Deltaproteobacteria bacterium]